MSVCSFDRDNFHAVVFSQFTSFLDLIETALNQAKMRYVRLDGTMDRKLIAPRRQPSSQSLSGKARAAAVKQFNDKSKPCVFIISMKAGGTG